MTYIPPSCRESDQGVLHDFMRACEFATVVDGWRAEDLPADYYVQLLRRCVAFEMPVAK